MEKQPGRRIGLRAPAVWIAVILACFAFASARAAGTGWQQLTLPSPRPLPRVGHTLTVLNGAPVLYAGATPSLTGPGDVALTDLWQFTPGTNSFIRLNSITGSPPNRTGHAAAALDGYLYAFFGLGGDGSLLSDVWLWDGLDSCWRAGEYPLAPTRPAPRMDHTAVSTDSHTILVFGGHGGTDGTTLLDDLWSFRPSDQTWAQKAPFPGGGRAGHAAVWLGGKMIVLGGVSAAGVQDDVWSYDPIANSWAQLTDTGSVPGGFTGAAAAVGDFLGTGTPFLLLTGGMGADNSDLPGTYRVDLDGTGHANWTIFPDGPSLTGSQAVAVSASQGAAPLLLLFGGTRAGAPLAETWTYSTNTPRPPNAPSNLTITTPATPGGSGSLSLTWTDNSSDETGFIVQRALEPGFSVGLSTLAALPANTTSLTDTGLPLNTSYYYRVKATGASSDSAYSASASGLTLPNAPSGLTAAANSPTQVTISWTDIDAGVLGFKLERKTGSGNYTQIAAPTVPNRQYVDTAVIQRTTYTYRMRATTASGDSAYSAESSVTVPAAPRGKLKVAGSVKFSNTAISSAGQMSLSIANTSKTDSLQVTVTTPAAPFACPTAPNTFVLAPRGSQTVTLTFTPAAKGSFKGTLILQTSDPAKKTAKVKLAGKGI